MIIDKHVHTPYCPHGSTDSFEMYIEQALRLQYSEISFTEHAPLPQNFIDPAPDKDSAMDIANLASYLQELAKLKSYYRKALKINIGLEVDYIEGFEGETKEFLSEYGHYLDDSILSVHFLKNKERYFCMDFSEEEFGRMIDCFGSLDQIYDTYYATLFKSIRSDLGTFKPKRLGHITLVEKFKHRFPHAIPIDHYVIPLLDEVAKRGYELDYNGAGFVKPLCKDSYPPSHIALEAFKRKIPLHYGSDAHSAKGLAQGYNRLEKAALDD